MKCLILYLYLLTLVLCGGSMLCAQRNLSLKEAVALALGNNLQVKIADTEIKIAEINNTLAASGAFPSVNAQLSQSNYVSQIDNAIEFANGFYTNSSANFSVNMGYVVFDGLKFIINKERLQLTQKKAEAVYEIQQQATALNVALSYYKVLMQKEKLEAAKQVFGFSKLRYNNADNQRRLGTISQFDLGQFEIAFLSDSAAVYTEQNIYELAMIELGLALGIDIDSAPIILTDPLQFKPIAYLKNSISQQVLANNAEYKQLLIDYTLVKTNTRLSKASLLPVLSANAGFSQGVNRIRFSNLPADTGGDLNFNFGFGLSVPIWDGNNRKRALKQSLFNEKIADLRLQNTAQVLKSQLNNYLAIYDRQLNLIVLQDKIIAVTSATLKLSEQRYNSGLSNFLEYRNLLAEFNKAQTARLQAIYELKVAELNLMLLSGNIKELFP